MRNAIIFPADPFNPRKPDEEFAHEAEIVRSLGGKIILVDHTALESEHFSVRNVMSQLQASAYDSVPDNLAEFVAELPDTTVTEAMSFYRGWMLSAEAYQFMRWQLGTRLVDMHSNTSDYLAGYYLPHWYDIFRDFTPRSTWFPAHSAPAMIQEVVTDYVSTTGPYIVKDYVKSRKNEWDTACFAPNLRSLQPVIDEFTRLQEEDNSLTGGIVVREFEEFDKSVGEARVWWVGNEPIILTPHPDTPELLPIVDVDFLVPAVEQFNRPFITTDLALRSDGTWRVVEVSDGQVSGIPVGCDSTPLFEKLLDYNNMVALEEKVAETLGNQ